ncbi:MAG: hypothetical protein KIT43_01715 [Bauldia sp.]|nr:hypothetical protein [Bauldia sp.]
MMDSIIPILATVMVLLAAGVTSGLARKSLQNRVPDQPNARSSHRNPVPRGGGIGFIPVVLVALILLAVLVPEYAILPAFAAGIVGAIAVAAVSFADDLRPLSGRVRFAVQAAAVALVLVFWPGGTILGPDIPVVLDRLVVGFAWLWFINLFNFMDGIDGIAASEAGVISAGIVAVAVGGSALTILPAVPAAIVGAGAIAFLTVNWPPAKVFMGDIGSITLGFLLGWLLLAVADAGYLAAAAILPLVFVLDATATLVLRILRGERPGEAHRDHAYQLAVDRGVPHAVVTSAVIVTGLGLIAIAVWSIAAPLPAIVAGATLSAGLVLALRFGLPPFQRRAGAGGETARRSR